jgi:hypothetical protein
MKQLFSVNRNTTSKGRKNQYQSYVITFIILFSICIVSKTLLDIKILMSTGRIVSTEDWVDLMLSQKEKIASNTQQNDNRILILSGSNGLFGISAKTISQETGIKTINLCSHAGLGGDYILSRAEKLIRKGDIILLPMEYEFYLSSGISSDFKKYDTLSRFMISYDKISLKKVSIVSLLNFVFSNAFSGKGKKEYISYFHGHLYRKDILERLKQQSITDGCYSGLTFNEYGDETCNIGKKNIPVDPAVMRTAIVPSMTDIDPGGYIERFVQFTKAKGAIIVPLYPVSTYTNDYKDLAFQESAQTVKKFWEDRGIDFQDSLMDSLLPPSLMYNTYYHPTDIGRQKRTKSIIVLIKKQLRDREDRR